MCVGKENLGRGMTASLFTKKMKIMKTNNKNSVQQSLFFFGLLRCAFSEKYAGYGENDVNLVNRSKWPTAKLYKTLLKSFK